MRVPLRLQARAITGVGDVAGAMLANPSIEGWLTITPKLVRGEDLQAHQRQAERQALAADRPRDRPLRGAPVGRDAALPDPGPRHRRRADRPSASFPDPNGQRLACRRHRQGLGAPARQQLLPRPDRRLAVARRPTSSAAPTASSASPTCSSIRPSCGCRAPASASATARFHIVAAGRQAKYGPLRMILDGAYRAAARRPVPRPPERRARHHRHAPAARADRGRVRLSRQRRLEARAVHQQRPHPACRRRADGDLDRRARRRRRACERRPDLRPGRVQRPADARRRNARRNARLRAGRRQAQRIDAHLTANNASFPGAFAVRSGRADGIIILADERTTVDGSRRCARHRRRRRSRSPGSPPTPSWSTAPARCARRSPAARGAGFRLLDPRRRRRPTRSASPAAAGSSASRWCSIRPRF